MFDPVQFLPDPHDALQEPCHRWLRCQYLLEYHRPPTLEDDPITDDAYHFLLVWRRCRDDAQRQQVAQAYPVLTEAHRLFEIASLRERAEVEARLLAGERDESIGGKCKLSPEVVHLFHELFFDVRSYLQASLYIVNMAIGPKYHYGLQADDYDVLLKIAGYTLGVSGVEELLAYWADPPVWPVALALLDDKALETLRHKLQMQSWILSLTLPADHATATRLPVIRQMLARAGVLGSGSESDENGHRSGSQPVLDYRAFLTAPDATVLKAAPPAGAAVAGEVGERAGSGLSYPEPWQTVPA